MCSKCDGVVRYDATKKQLLYRVGCDWLPVPLSVTSGGGAGVPVGDYNGEPIPDGAEVPHDNPLYQTMDSLKCAKATALVNEMWNLLSIHEDIEGGDVFADILQRIADITGLNLIAPTTELFFLIADLGLPALAEEFEEVHLDTALKENLICELVDQMVAPVKIGALLFNKITASDITALYAAFKAATPGKTIIHRWIDKFPVSSWDEIVTKKVASTECGCNTYAPTPSEPTLGANQVRIALKQFMGWHYNYGNTGQVIAQALAVSSRYGQRYGANGFQSSNPIVGQNSTLHSLLICFEKQGVADVTIKRIKYLFTTTGGGNGKLWIGWGSGVTGFPQVEISGNNNLSGTFIDYAFNNTAAHNLIFLQFDNENGAITLPSVIFDIEVNGVVYTNVVVDQIVTHT